MLIVYNLQYGEGVDERKSKYQQKKANWTHLQNDKKKN